MAGRGALLAEVFAVSAADAAPVGFVLAHLRPGPVLWVQDRLSRRESGRPCLAGMPPGLELFTLTVSKPADLLRAMEEGLSCPALSAVVGEVWGAAPALDFTASKRLAMRAEAEKVPAWLIRRSAAPDLSAARARWHLASLPSPPAPEDLTAPGPPTWSAQLFRARWRSPAEWVVRQEQGAAAAFLHQSAPPERSPARSA